MNQERHSMHYGLFQYKLLCGIAALLLFQSCATVPGEAVGARSAAAVKAPAPNSYYYYTEAQILKNRGQIQSAIEMMQEALAYDPEAIYVRRELATLYLQNQEEERALEMLQAILTDAPGDVPTLMLLGRIYQNRDEVEQAKATYETLLDQDAEQEDVYLILGNLYMEDRQWGKAYDVFRRLTERFPGAYAGFFFLGRIHREQGEDPKAEAAFRRSLAIEPQLEGARYELIEIYEERPDSEAARGEIRRQYQAILDQDPANLRAACGLALFYHRIGKEDQARERIATLAAVATENDLVRTLFRDYLEPGKSREAVYLLEAILQNRPNAGSLHYLLGVAYGDLEESARAMTHFKAVPPASRFYRDAVIQQAFHLSEAGEIEAAITLLEDALTHHPDHPDFLVYLASMYEEKEAYDDALAALARAIDADPESERAHFRLGVVYDKMGRKDDSIAAMQKVIALKPDHANALNYLGYTYADLGINLEEAERLVQKALELKPDDGYITDSLGWVYYKQGRYQKALPLLLKAAELVGDDPIIFEHVGDTLKALGRHAEALEYYRKSLSVREKDRESLLRKIEALEAL
jgi:tetratricopeptide (TPR) repeat protein